ncbi:hypothetical protein FBY41_0905 [Humibacillus xanthopallidus]|uniref:Uncharacterized protein n=2 Tax=Humibacillus xanthopallidus TaxID=412689 RepID=A0A543I1R4_9MICO|nr:hypothetical protein FBY41_0905 [Humibacillus xanthopallidus]
MAASGRKSLPGTAFQAIAANIAAYRPHIEHQCRPPICAAVLLPPQSLADNLLAITAEQS